ncbi:MAG: anti-sigma factor [Anaeromyxobacter sp.]
MTTPTPHLSDAQAQLLVDGALLPFEATAHEAHAAGCPDCRALILSYRLLGEALGDLEVPEIPLDFTEGVMASIELRQHRVARERRWAIGILAAVSAALVTVAVLSGGTAWLPATQRLTSSLTSTLSAFHAGADLLGPVVSALRVQIAALCAAVALPFLFLLSRLMPAPRTEIA